MRRVAEELGWELDHWRGDHMLFKKKGAWKTVAIPNIVPWHRELPEGSSGIWI